MFSSIWPIDMILSGATTMGHIRPGSDGNDGVLRIPQSFSITGTSPSDCLVWHSFGGLTPLERCSRCIQQPQPTGQCKYMSLEYICKYMCSSFGQCLYVRVEIKRTMQRNIHLPASWMCLYARRLWYLWKIQYIERW